MIAAYTKALSQLSDPRFLRAVFFGILLAVAALIALWVSLGFGLRQVPWEDLPVIGWFIAQTNSWIAEAAIISFILGAGGMTWLLFPAAAVASIMLFLDNVCDAVEAKHYPFLPAPRARSFLDTLWEALKFLLVTVAINIIALPFYLGLLWVFGSGAILYIVINGYLISREFWEQVALRRLESREARRLRKRHQGRIIVFGAATIFLMTIPLLNLLMPVLATAAMVHIFHQLNDSAQWGTA